METNKRSLAKAISYRFVGTIVTFMIAFTLTGDFLISSAVGVADLIFKTLLFYLHERLWNYIKWGHKNDR
jgi:adenylylsulfate kinase